MGTGRVILAAAVVLTGAARSPGQAAWWNFKWSHRRVVTVSDVPRTRLPGEEVAVVTMPTGGLVRPDGRDIRVATGAGTLLPHRVLMVGPGDRVRVAFALRGGITRYYVYFGNADAPKPTGELKVRRGVLLEMWAHPGGTVRNLQQATRLLERVRELIGRDFLSRVFLGHNPFGPQDRVCSVFTGHLICRNAGEYEFSTSSRDASFLLVDGKLVVSNGGRHRPQRRAVRRGEVRLSAGLHELKLYHVNAGGDPVAVAAWKEPRGRRLWAIPPGAFAPVRRARCGIAERYGKSYHADFLPVHAGEAFMANKYYQRYTFEALLKGASVTPPKYQWDFGDGQSATHAKCDHVYLRTGPFKVTLTVRLAGQTLTRANRIYVTRAWEKVTRPRLDPLADHAGIVSGYDFTRAEAPEICEAIALLKRAGMSKAILRAGDALVKRDAAPAGALAEAMDLYAEALVADGQAARAVAAMLKAAEMTRAPAVRAVLTTAAGEMALKVPDLDRALAIFQQALKKYSALTTGGAIRQARIGIGDVWRARGDYAKAAKAYQAARPAGEASFEKQAVRKGDLARHAEDYIRRRQYADAEEFLGRLEQEFPAEKLEGFSTLLRVRLELARRRPAAAAEQVEQLIRVNPRSNYAPELLNLAEQAYRKQGQRDLARRALQRIVTNYPESPLAAEARKRLTASQSAPKK